MKRFTIPVREGYLITFYKIKKNTSYDNLNIFRTASLFSIVHINTELFHHPTTTKSLSVHKKRFWIKVLHHSSLFGRQRGLRHWVVREDSLQIKESRNTRLALKAIGAILTRHSTTSTVTSTDAYIATWADDLHSTITHLKTWVNQLTDWYTKCKLTTLQRQKQNYSLLERNCKTYSRCGSIISRSLLRLTFELEHTH